MTDLEPYRPTSGLVPLAVDFDDLMKKATVLAKSGLVRKPLEDKPEAIVAVAIRGAELGVSLMTALDEIDVIEGKTYLSAQLCSSLVRAAGHELEVLESTEERCTIRGRRREQHRTGEWQETTWTIERARVAGFLDEYVVRWVSSQNGGGKKYPERFVLDREGVETPDWAAALVRAGKVQRRDNWYRHPTEMLRARAMRELCRFAFGDVLSGLDVEVTAEDVTASGPSVVTDADLAAERARDDEVAEAEVIEEEPSPGDGPDVSAPDPHDASRQDLSDATRRADQVTDDVDAEAEEAAATWDVDAWTEHLRSVGVTAGKALTTARHAAVDLDLEPPTSLEAITDPRIARSVLDLEGDAA